MADQVQSEFAPNRTIQIPGAAAGPGLPGLPDTVPVKMLDRKSADFEQYSYAWDLMYWLYVGGAEIESVAEQFLKKRSKELPDVYQSRVERFYYESHIGTCVDWYLASLFETPPQVETALEDLSSDEADTPITPPPAPAPTIPGAAPAQAPAPAGAPVPTPMTSVPKKITKTPAQADDFYDSFEQNCDHAGTPLLETFRAYLRDLLIFGRAAMLIDLPAPGEYRNLMEQKKAGALDPYLLKYDPRQMINYEKDKNGMLLWALFSVRQTILETPFADMSIVDTWYYYDQHRWAMYQRTVPQGESSQGQGAPADAVAQKIGEGMHSMSDQGLVPVIYMELPKGMWLTNRAYSVTKEHLNTYNAFSWALYMSCLAMPVIKMDGDYVVELSEAGFIKLPKDADYSWSEPEGKSFEQMAKRLDALKEEIFRAFYLIAQSRSITATASAASGISKQQDMMASKKVLNLFGDVMRAMIQTTYQYVSYARKDGLRWDVRGLNFPEGPPGEEVDTVAGAQAIGVPSLAFEKELFKKVVMATIPDMNPKKKAQIFEEIEAAPSAADMQVQMLQQRARLVQSQNVFPKGSV